MGTGFHGQINNAGLFTVYYYLHIICTLVKHQNLDGLSSLPRHASLASTQDGGGVGWEAESRSVLAAHSEKSLWCVFPGFVCMWFLPLCPQCLQSLKCSGAGSVANRRGRGTQAFEPSPCKRQTRIQTRPSKEAAEERDRLRSGARGKGLRGPGAVGGVGWGVCPARWKAEGEVSSGMGVGVGGGRKKENPPSPPSPPPLCACLCSLSTSAGRPCSQGGGGGDGQAEEAEGGWGGFQVRPFLSLSYLERTISRSVSSVSDLWHSKPDYSSH